MTQPNELYYRKLAVAKYAKEHPNETNESIGKRFGISERSVRRYRQDLPKLEKTEVLEEVGTSRIKKELASLKSKYEAALKLVEEKDQTINSLLLIDSCTAPTDFNIEATEKREVVPVIVASDWHIEETVTPGITNNRNEYNLDIAEDSVKQFFTNACYLVNRAKQDSKVNTVVLAILGDIINGVLRSEDLETNQTTSIDALAIARSYLYEGIKKLAADTGCNIKVVCCVGNHGRLTEKIHFSNQVHHSLEYLIYKTLERDFRDMKSVEFVVAEGPWKVVDILGYKVRFSHGHMVKFAQGSLGLSVPVLRKVAQMNTIEHADYDVMGHWHSTTMLPNVVINGSLVGVNGYSMFKGLPFEPPSQVYFQIDSKYGKSMITPILIDRKVGQEK